MEVWGSNKGLKLCIWQIFCRGSYFECDLHCDVKWINSFEVINFAGGRLTARNFTFLVLLRLVVNTGVWSGKYGVLPVVKWYIGETPTWEFYGIVDISSSKSSFPGDKQHLTSLQYLFLREIFYTTQLLCKILPNNKPASYPNIWGTFGQHWHRKCTTFFLPCTCGV